MANHAVLDSLVKANTSFVNVTGIADGLSKHSNSTAFAIPSKLTGKDGNFSVFPVTLPRSKTHGPMAAWVSNMSEFEKTRLKTQPSSNTSSEFPNFIRPSVNPKAGCNLWGLLCQTGLVEVGVNLTSTVTTTTVPCSYYLSAQSKSAMYQQWAASMEYVRSFGHSPECTAYAEVVHAQERFINKNNSKNLDELNSIESSVYADANCERDISHDFASYTPAGVSNSNVGGGASDFFCCGECTLVVPEIRLLYFPGPTRYECAHGFQNSTKSMLSTGSRILEKRFHSLLTNKTTLVSDGYTL